MYKKAVRRGAAAAVGDSENPTKYVLGHSECLGVCYQEKNEGGVKGIFCF